MIEGALSYCFFYLSFLLSFRTSFSLFCAFICSVFLHFLCDFLNSYTFDTENMGKIMTLKKNEAGQRLGGQVKKQLRTIFENRYRSGKNLWFFSKLRF